MSEGYNLSNRFASGNHKRATHVEKSSGFVGRLRKKKERVEVEPIYDLELGKTKAILTRLRDKRTVGCELSEEYSYDAVLSNIYKVRELYKLIKMLI